MSDDDIAGDHVDEVETTDTEPKSSRGWLADITESEKYFREYQDKADNIDKQYANLNILAGATRDRQFQLFWANIQVLGPSIYSRPPIPVVVPRFRDRNPLPRLASELLERACIVAFEQADIDSVMRLVRDDLSVQARGVAWLRYETKSESDSLSERVCIEHVDRKDFLHEPARTWAEVGWVAKRSWLTKKDMKARFKSSSGDAYKDAAYEVKKEDDEDVGREKAGVWEIWSKTHKRVVWVSEGVDKLLDDIKPHLELQDFYPCPRPAFSTVERRTLVPVPDMLFYKDQLEEINELTARISSLTEAVRIRGFYPAGAGEIGDAIEAAIKNTSDNQILIPISNWAMLGNGSVKDMIVWLPIEVIVKTIRELVDMRKQLIEDVYQITGLSDIMRGQTQASETLGAQQLKSQYGSVRIKDRQGELVRMARDIARLTAEIMSENFQEKTLVDMSHMEIDNRASIAVEVKPLNDQLSTLIQKMQMAGQDPQVMQMAQQNPEKAQQVIQQLQQQAQQLHEQIGKIKEKPTIEDVMKLLKEQRTRPFVLDIETDSTIAPDENEQKQRATEYVTAVGGFMGQAFPLVQQAPQIAPIVAEMLKFTAGQFRAGREMQTKIEEFGEAMAQYAQQPKPPDPAANEAKLKQDAIKAETERKQAETQAALKAKDAEHQQQMGQKQQQAQLDAEIAQFKAQKEMELKAHQVEAETQLKAKAADDQSRIEFAKVAGEEDNRLRAVATAGEEAAARDPGLTLAITELVKAQTRPKVARKFPDGSWRMDVVDETMN